MLYPKITYHHLGNIHFWEKKEIELEFKNPRKSDLKLEVVIISEWLELLSEKEILFSGEESKKIRFLVNGLNISSGNHWSEVLLCEYLKKEVVFREIIFGTFLPESTGTSSKKDAEPLIKVSPDLIDIGNIIKGSNVIRNFEIENNDTFYMRILLTCDEDWIKLICARDKEGKEFHFKDNKVVEFEIPPLETFIFDVEVNTKLCIADLKHMAVVKISFPVKNIPEQSVKIKLNPFNVRHFLIDFHEVNMGSVTAGEEITRELQIAYLGERHDITLAGEMISLSEWLKIEHTEFLLKYGGISTIKFHCHVPEDMSKGKKEAFVLVNFHPEKCFPKLPSIPQQIGKVILDVCDNRKVISE